MPVARLGEDCPMITVDDSYVMLPRFNLQVASKPSADEMDRTGAGIRLPLSSLPP